MQKRKDRIIIDTNLWISFLLTKGLSDFDTIIADGEVTLIFSEELLNEFVEVTQREKFRKYFDLADLDSLLMQIGARAVFVPVKSKAIVCRDPKDNFLLSLAVDGKATHLITGDKDLLVLKKYDKTKIVTITEYLGALK